jgi:hypothetical protein
MGCYMRRPSRLAWFALPLAIGLGSASAQAPTLAGEWLSTPLRADWVIGDWGPACGPRPSGGGAPGGTVMIRQNGVELSMGGAGRAYSTTECWEQFPGLTRTSHSASARSYRNVCKTGAKDPRQATVITTISATDSQITFDETGQYQFIIEGQNCTASVRRTRFLRLVRREGEAAPPPATASAPAAQPSAEEVKPTACANPGEPARLEVRPSRKLVRPGETFTFRPLVTDRAGCPLTVAPTFKLAGAPLGVELLGPGTLRVSEEAGEGEVKLLATLGERSVTVVAEIVSRERYDSILNRGEFNPSGESAEVAVTRIESGSIGARGAVLRDDSETRRTVFIAIVGSAALLLGLFGLVAVRRSRRQMRQNEAPPSLPPRTLAIDPPPQARRAAPVFTPPPPAAVPAAKGMICPTCREEYPLDARFCANDANRLVPLQPGLGVVPAGGVCPTCGQGFDPGVASCPKHDEPLVPAAVYAAALESRKLHARKICPVCGAQFPGESQFCGKCGAGLVPVN